MWKLLSLVCCLGVVAAQKNLVLVGGGLGDNNNAIWEKVVELAGGSGSARIGVVTAASADPEGSANYYIERFESYGAAEVYFIPVYEGNEGANSDPDVVDRINEMGGFFFGGGDQRRIIASFYNNGREESPALEALKARYTDGAVVGGTSAGAMCVNSAPMITGGMSWDALAYGSYEDGSEIGRDDLTFDPQGGLGLVDGLIVDTHFSERGREGRLVRLMADTQGRNNGATKGAGVDEDTALVIYNVGQGSERAEVIGEAGVFLADIGQANVDDSGVYWGITDVNTFYLTMGDAINLRTMAVTFAGWKDNMKGQEANSNAAVSSKIFNGNRDNPNRLGEYAYVSASVLDARSSTRTWGVTEESGPRFRCWFEELSATEGYGGWNPSHGNFDIAYANLDVQMIYDS